MDSYVFSGYLIMMMKGEMINDIVWWSTTTANELENADIAWTTDHKNYTARSATGERISKIWNSRSLLVYSD